MDASENLAPCPIKQELNAQLPTNVNNQQPERRESAIMAGICIHSLSGKQPKNVKSVKKLKKKKRNLTYSGPARNKGRKSAACQECGNVEIIEARGLCSKCYLQFRINRSSNLPNTVAMRNKLKKVDVCGECQTVGMIEARGLCSKCYLQFWKKRSLNSINAVAIPIKCGESGVCKNCRKVKILKARGLCSNCYLHFRTNRILASKTTVSLYSKYKKSGVCKKCGNVRILKPRGLCSTCYLQFQKDQSLNPTNFDTISSKCGESGACKECGSVKVLKARGLCSNCYEHFRTNLFLNSTPKNDQNSETIRQSFFNTHRAQITCQGCQKEACNHGYGLCRPCYYQLITKPKLQQKSAASNCYEHFQTNHSLNSTPESSQTKENLRRSSTKQNSTRITCQKCQKEAENHGRGMCRRCYYAVVAKSKLEKMGATGPQMKKLPNYDEASKINEPTPKTPIFSKSLPNSASILPNANVQKFRISSLVPILVNEEDIVYLSSASEDEK